MSDDSWTGSRGGLGRGFTLACRIGDFTRMQGEGQPDTNKSRRESEEERVNGGNHGDCLETPTSRAISAAVRPASSCFSTPMICSVFSFLFAILLPPSFARNHTSFRASSEAQVRPMRRLRR